jgi:hypothetical protein
MVNCVVGEGTPVRVIVSVVRLNKEQRIEEMPLITVQDGELENAIDEGIVSLI